MKTLHLVDENIAIILSSVSANQHLDEVYSLWIVVYYRNIKTFGVLILTIALYAT